jgi:antitoxin FitA
MSGADPEIGSARLRSREFQMRCAWVHLSMMSKMIQIRNVPDELHGELRRRAAKLRVPLTTYLEGVLEREAARPMAHEVFDRIAARSPVQLDEPVAETLRAQRTNRDPR